MPDAPERNDRSPPPGVFRLLTPRATGGLAIVRVAGPGSRAFLERRAGIVSAGLRLGVLRDAAGVVDRVLAKVDGDTVEISAHGSIAVVEALERLLRADGFCEESQPGDAWIDAWPAMRRAPAIFAEAWEGLLRATAPQSVAFHAAALDGPLVREIESLAGALEGAPPEGAKVDSVAARLAALLERAAVGLAFTEPPSVVLFGPVNAGKSSLFNRLLEDDRSLVSDEPGTTRDVVRARLTIGGYPFRVADLAGERATADPVESLGVERARRARAGADIVLLVRAVGDESSDAAAEPTEAAHPTILRVLLKVDLVSSREREAMEARGVLAVSSATGYGIERLRGRILQASPFARGFEGAPTPFTERQATAIRAAAALAVSRPSAAAAILRASLGD